MFQPLVSVVIPTYNRERYIAEAIDSVLAQTYTNVQIIVIDDGSTDNTRQVVEKYAADVQYVWQQNSERGASRNRGLALAKGDFISFLDSDDVWLPGKLESEVSYLIEHPKVGLVCSDVVVVDANGVEIKGLRIKKYSGNVTKHLLDGNFVLMASHLARTELIRRAGGFREERELSGSEDWELWVRLSTITDFGYMNSPNGLMRTHSGNTMTNPAAMARSMDYAIQIMSQSDYLDANMKAYLRKARSIVSLINAINYCSAGNRRKSAEALWQSLIANPAIVGDLRFGYTLLRLPFRGAVSRAKV